MSSNPRNRRALTLKEGQFYGPNGQAYPVQAQLLASTHTLSVQPSTLLSSVSTNSTPNEENITSHRLVRHSISNPSSGSSSTTFNHGPARMMTVESTLTDVIPKSIDRTKAQILTPKKPSTPVETSRNSSGHATQGTFGDRVIFEESSAHPNVPLVYRTQEERAANPDRLSLDRRGLSVCPILEGEENLRLLNYQHNIITKIQHLSSLRKLIFLDLYDNQISQITGLSSLKSLRVLMLGKNQIKKIYGLENLLKLDVLDLHGNEIDIIENLHHLTELRVLNLAGNRITHVKEITGMRSLTELNLRRNQIKIVEEIDNLPNLQRLFLSFNEITCWTNISSLGYSNSLCELTLDGNPFAKEVHYKQTVVANILQLRQFDMKRISEEERRIATAIARKEEEKRRETTKINAMKEKRRAAINNARKQWEVGSSVNSSAPLSTSGRSNVTRMPGVNTSSSSVSTISLPRSKSASGTRTSSTLQPVENEEPDMSSSARSTSRMSMSRPDSARSLNSSLSGTRSIHNGGMLTNMVAPINPNASDSGVCSGSGQTTSNSTAEGDDDRESVTPEPEEDLTGSRAHAAHLAEVTGDTLCLYGSGALEAFDRQWGLQAAGAVHIISFRFIEFDDLARHLHRLRARFPSVGSLSFENVNLRSFSQFNALATLRRLEHLTVCTSGNPVTEFKQWRHYVLFRLAFFKLKTINGMDVTQSDVLNAEKLFSGLCHATISQKTSAQLLLQMEEVRRKASGGDSSHSKMPPTGSANDQLGRSGLHHQSDDQLVQRKAEVQKKDVFADAFVTELVNTTAVVDQRKVALAKAWSDILPNFLQSVVSQVCKRQDYSKSCWKEFASSNYGAPKKNS